jgi:hypothetical protein
MYKVYEYVEHTYIAFFSTNRIETIEQKEQKDRLFSAKERNALKIIASIESNLAREVYRREY